jgi:hypothetical protein
MIDGEEFQANDAAPNLSLLVEFVPMPMNYPAASCGISEERDENYPKGVTPECFYRGSSQSFAWIPA